MSRSAQPGSAALVTGASSGIGRALAVALAAQGVDLVLVARRRDRLETLADEIQGVHDVRAHVVSCDLADSESRERLHDRVASIGVEIETLVLCAGFGMGGAFITQDRDRVLLMLRTNFEGAVSLTGMFAPGMAERRRGRILFVSSVAGNQPIVGMGAYAATKAAVTSFAETLHEELRPYGVAVTVLCPGAVDTEFAEVADMEGTTARIPSLLMSAPEEIALAGLSALEHGKRRVVPGRATQLLHFAGGHVPRELWLRTSRKLMA